MILLVSEAAFQNCRPLFAKRLGHLFALLCMSRFHASLLRKTVVNTVFFEELSVFVGACLLYTSDAADDA